MKKVLWLSRHEMTEDQKKDLAINFGEVCVAHQNHTWHASERGDIDVIKNSLSWNTFKEIVGKGGMIAGVFPPVALESIPRNFSITVITPVSSQSEIEREDGSKKIEFVHVRWAVI